MEDKSARLCWRVIPTGYSGKGEPLPEEDARKALTSSSVSECNKRWYMEHWIEPEAREAGDRDGR